MRYKRLRSLPAWSRLPSRVRRPVREDRRGLPPSDPGPEAAKPTADRLPEASDRGGFLPGWLAPGWNAAATWAGLTGTARYLDAAVAANPLEPSLREAGNPFDESARR